jgi:hypothetical protein
MPTKRRENTYERPHSKMRGETIDVTVLHRGPWR